MSSSSPTLALCNPKKWSDARAFLAGTQRIDITILGCTGSIGRAALEIVREHPDRFKVVGLGCAGSNLAQFADQITEFGPRLISVESLSAAAQLASRFPKLQLAIGASGAVEVAKAGKLVIAAISGVAGLQSTVAALENDAIVALANKESIVCGVEILRKIRTGMLIPVDSEHSSLAQLMLGVTDIEHVSSLTLTASGGPFLNRDLSTFSSITLQEAIRHPKWRMGAKISIDSSTLVNKALEWFEAVYLFGFSQVNIVIHPQSIVHACVSLRDGATLANLSYPDMKLPIGFAMGVGDRFPGLVKSLDLTKLGNLSFMAVDEARFPSITLARDAIALEAFGTCLYSLANEVAVERFSRGELLYTEIVQFISKALSKLSFRPIHSIEAVENLLHQVRSLP